MLFNYLEEKEREIIWEKNVINCKVVRPINYCPGDNMSYIDYLELMYYVNKNNW